MTNSRKGIWVLIIVVILVIIALLLLLAASGTSSLPPTTTQTQPGVATSTVQTVQASYSCDDGKSIQAIYLNATTATTTGNMVQLTLSDGRQFTLAQTISADGARYSNGNPQFAQGQPGAETFVFWSKGNGAIVLDNGTSTYNNCVTQTQ